MPKPKRQSPPTTTEPAHPPLRCVAMLREPEGYRLIVSDVPADIVAQYMVRTREPNLREVAEEGALRALTELYR